MKLFWQGLVNICPSLILAVERYFLGPMAAQNKSLSQERAHARRQGLKPAWILKLAKDDEILPLTDPHDQALDDVVMLVMGLSSGGGNNIGPCHRRQSYLLFPQVVERAAPMIGAFIKQIGEPVVLLLENPSRLPSQADFAITNPHLRQEAHEQAFEAMFENLKRLHVTCGLGVRVSDHEEILGKKNSAFLRRIFLEHNM